jgi:cell division protein FtsL
VDVLLLIPPLVAVVAVLACVAIFFARKARGTKLEIKQLIDGYIQEKAKERQALNKELGNLDRLLNEKKIDQETYDRLKNVLMTMNEKKTMDAGDLFAYVTERRKK